MSSFIKELYCFQMTMEKAIVHLAEKVLKEMDGPLITSCYRHCGYNV